jgi:dihydrofolate reductase
MSLHDRPSSPTIPTPPPTVLHDNESPTTSDPDLAIMATLGNMVRRPLYLIVATAVEPHMGMGYQGGLPWKKGLKTDMGFFRRVTMRGGNGAAEEEERGREEKGNNLRARNAVIMGRKTWESIPSKFRPLKGRVNVVITRNAHKLQDEISQAESNQSQDEVVIASSLKEGLKQLRQLRQRDNGLTTEEGGAKDFVIGGSEIYRAALDLTSSLSSMIPEHHGVTGKEDEDESPILRILQTQVRKLDGNAFECDVFFPVDLPGSDSSNAQGWRKAGKAETESWIDEPLPQPDADWTTDVGGECEIMVLGWEKMG